MAKNLVIVESPSKSKTIEKYLGSDYKVVSSMGHIRDLATSGKFGFGVDIEDNFRPTYEVSSGKKKVVSELKKEIKTAEKVFLASDPDREGEAISWHLLDALSIKEKNYSRIVFNEITKNAVLESLNHQRKIDDDLVHSQETRRIIDRIMGFRLSKLMQSKTEGKSAGRVQSVALKLVVDREREIEKFIAEEYWEIEANFNDFVAKLFKYQDNDLEIPNEESANEIMSKLSNAFEIESIEKASKKRKSKAPFITSTLQQEASNKLGFSAKKTMMIAQKLYEGIDLSDETTGLISYMRTDSIRLSDDFIKETYAFIDKTYGSVYVGYVKTAKSKDNVQDAHEAIRPTSINRTPESVRPYLKDDEYKLYTLIYNRALASLMKDASLDVTTVILDNNDYKFKATGHVITFDGYLKVYGDIEEDETTKLPALDTYQSKVLVAVSILPSQHFTKPPARYTEAKLIKEMEELGIGRPSTYAKTMDTIKERDYVSVVDKKFIPTEVGFEITDKLQEFFSNLINVEYTSKMETELDDIAEGSLVWYELLKTFWSDFEPVVDEAFHNMEKKAPEETGEVCPECGGALVYKKGKYGKFIACGNFPECKYIKPKEIVEKKEVAKCPKCDEGMILERKSKKGKIFYGCGNYPKCTYALWDRPTGEICATCGGLLVETKSGVKCPVCSKEIKE